MADDELTAGHPPRRATAGQAPCRAAARHWAVPAAGATVAAVYFLLSDAVLRREVDLGTYLFGAARVLGPGLYRAVYPPTHLGFTYPPFLALLLVPCTGAPVLVDQLAFTTANLVLVALLVATCLRAARPDLRGQRLAWWTLALLGPAGLIDPVKETLTLGQVNVLVVLAVVADVVAVSGIRLGSAGRMPRGVLVGLAAAIKLTPLAFVPVLLLAGDRRAAWRATATFGGVTAASAAVVPRTAWEYWSHVVFDVRRIGSTVWVSNQSVRGVVLRFAHHGLAVATTDAVGVAVLAAGVPLAAAWCRRGSPLLGAVVGWAAESLASPVTWTAQLVWIIPLLAWLALAPDRPRRGRRWAVGVAVVSWLAPNWWVSGVPHVPRSDYAEAWWQLPIGDTFALLAVAVLIGAAVLVRRSRPGTTGAPAAPERGLGLATAGADPVTVGLQPASAGYERAATGAGDRPR